MRRKLISVFVVQIFIISLFACSKTSYKIEYVSVSYEDMMLNNVQDGVYLFSRNDCSACIELFSLIDNVFMENNNLFKHKTIYLLETSELDLEEKTEIINRYDAAYVPKIIKIKNNEIVYEKIGSFSKDNIRNVLLLILEEN